MFKKPFSVHCRLGSMFNLSLCTHTGYRLQSEINKHRRNTHSDSSSQQRMAKFYQEFQMPVALAQFYGDKLFSLLCAKWENVVQTSRKPLLLVIAMYANYPFVVWHMYYSPFFVILFYACQ